MTEFLVGLAVGVLTMAPAWLAMRNLRDETQERLHEAADLVSRLDKENHSLTLQLAAPTAVERAGIAALLDRPDPEPEVAGRWLYDDTGLSQTFVPDGR